MIVKPYRSWLHLVFTWQGSSLPDTWWRILAVALISVAVTLIHPSIYNANNPWPYSLTLVPFTLIGGAVGIFLGFRNNESYERFWEGRILWGRLVNVARTFTRQLFTLLEAQPREGTAEVTPEEFERLTAFRREMVYRTIGYCHALRHHLRDSSPLDDLRPFLPDEEWEGLSRRLPEYRNVPMVLMQQLGARLAWARRRGWVTEYLLPQLDDSLTEMTSIQGGCERIRSTPLPHTYTVLIHQIVGAYCFLLPFGIVDSVQTLTPLVSVMVAYAFFGLDDIGDEIEEPFGTQPNDLPLHAISRNIEINLRQILGETDLPPAIQPVDYLLQ